ncbi:thiamine phosphate synthase [Sphingosinicella terrae]|uniref:thiamine phosphate synthase n=1 Tax=Sphingosinicella terrae TaxID=2172047 RepID=UPI0025498961|nr:thiamine phosphate synthase [Sphingosinicella terrae]
MTDERLGEHLMEAIARLPRGSGIVFRHYRLEAAARRALFDRVRKAARRQRLLLLLAGTGRKARAWHADGSHGRGGGVRGLRSAPAHDLREIRAAERSGADLVFLSPVHATRSHPGARALGRIGFARLARQSRLPVVALGGMDARRGRALAAAGAYGWAGIDAWMGQNQKRKAVPT